MAEENNEGVVSGAGIAGFGEFAAVAHELKTPLSIIAHLAASIDDEELGLTPQERRVAVERIRLSAERTLRLVQGLTTAYRLGESDQLPLRFALEPLNLAQVCEEAAHELAPFAKQHRQTLQLHLGVRRAQLVVGNRELLGSILFNLLDNANKHNPPDTAVSMTLRRRQRQVRVSVHDDGPGLGRKVFQALNASIGNQLQPLGSRSGGSGLGLYIAGQMAAVMGGRLSVGQPKVGADFRLDLLRSRQLGFFAE